MNISPLAQSLFVGAGVMLLAGSRSYYYVDGGHKAVLFSRFGGVKPDIYNEGLHLRIPIVHKPIIYSIRSRPTKIGSPTGTYLFYTFYFYQILLLNNFKTILLMLNFI